MEEGLKKLREYASMGANIPKKEFVTIFKEIARTGTTEEVNAAREILNSLITIPELEMFVENGMASFTEIRKSRFNYSRIESKLSYFQNDELSIAIIANSYDKITDPYFLRRANALVTKYPGLMPYITIRKTKKELEEEKEEKREDEHTFYQQYTAIFDEFNKYLAHHTYNENTNNYFFEQFYILRMYLEKYKDALSAEKYKEVLAEITRAEKHLNNVTESMEEESSVWSK